MPVRFDVDPDALRAVRRLPAKIEGQVLRTLTRMQETFERGEQPHDMRPLYSRSYPNSFRVDSGAYRVLFSVEQQTTIW